MLFQLTYVLPSDQSGGGAGTIDVTKDIDVSWQVNGASGMVAYQIVIMQNDTASTQVYTTGKVTLDEPFYGVDYNGNVQYFSVSLTSPAGMVNGYANGYKMVITQWWSDTESVAQTSASYFITRSEPTLTLDNLPETVTTRTGEFTATYSQAQGDTLNWFRWRIAEYGEVDDPLKDTGYIYGTEDIRVDYDGFFSGTEYMIRCQIETQNGVTADTGWQQFNVEYTTTEQRGLVAACRASGRSAVLVNWSEATYILGTADGDYSISDSQLALPGGSSVTWDTVSGSQMSFSRPWTIAWRGKPTALPITVWEMTGSEGETFSLTISATQITITRNGDVIYTFAPGMSFTANQWAAIVLTPERIYIRNSYAADGLYPSDTLYPSETLFPLEDVAYFNTYSEAIDYEQFNINSIKLNGPQVCAYLWITKGTPASEVISQVLTNGEFVPEFDENTYFLANFENGLNAGSLSVAADDVSGFSIYRRTGSESAIMHLADVGLSTTSLFDYSAKSQTPYTYYIFAISPTVYITQPLVSAEITPVFWDWVILECSEDESGVFHVLTEHRFSNNVVTGSIGNNSEPNLLTNFTRYPKRQPVAANFKSGTLQGYIGYVDFENNTYVDTPDMADALFELSTSENPKFLKNRKGDIWRIETSGAITMTVGDNIPQQPYTGAIPWVEVGSAENASVILEEGG